MKSLSASVLFLLLVSNISLYAQSKVTGTISIETHVIQSIELITVNSMTFGNTRNGEKLIYVNPINDVNAGFMIALGTVGAEFRLNYFQERRITRIDGPGYLTFSYEISGNDIEDQSTSELLENENRDIRFNEEGKFYIWVGGRVDLSNAPPGDYEGDFTIEIDYI